MLSHQKCPCGSGDTYASCCEVFHNDIKAVESVTQLLRARYSAFVLKYADFIQLTMMNPSLVHFDESDILNSPVKWHGLDILAVEEGTKHDTQGVVEFRVTCSESAESNSLFSVRERSLFKYVDSQWFYVDALDIEREELG